jgi:hypothetical protein
MFNAMLNMTADKSLSNQIKNEVLNSIHLYIQGSKDNAVLVQ